MTCTTPDCGNPMEHRHCASCSTVLPGAGPNLCPHHHNPDAEWAAANRVFCALIHRGVEPPPVVLEPAPEPEWADVA